LTWDKKTQTSNIICATVDDWRLIFAAFQKHFDMTPKEFDEVNWLWLRSSLQLVHVPGGPSEDDATVDDEGYLFVSDADATSTSIVDVLHKFEFEHVSSLSTDTGPCVMFGEISEFKHFCVFMPAVGFARLVPLDPVIMEKLLAALDAQCEVEKTTLSTSI
jgi:hypothetical protein